MSMKVSQISVSIPSRCRQHVLVLVGAIGHLLHVLYNIVKSRTRLACVDCGDCVESMVESGCAVL